MRKRQVWIEPLFAEAKQWHGMERMRLSTLERANCEILVTASGQNVKRLMQFGGGRPGRPAQVAALRPPTRPPLHLDCQRYGGCQRSLARYRGVSQHAAYEYFIDGTSANRLSRKFEVGVSPEGACAARVIVPRAAARVVAFVLPKARKRTERRLPPCLSRCFSIH
jgi:hypothetical protein